MTAMKKIIFTLSLFFLYQFVYSQSNSYDYVYSILQSRCASCHSNASPAGNLDLEGSGATAADKANEVYGRLVTFSADPANAFAKSEGYKVVYPGNAWLSSLFRKVNAGLQPNMVLDPLEGDDHSNPADHTITDVEKEAIRQWLLFGAPKSGKVLDVPLIQRYYNGQAVPSFTTPPPAPDPSEGFQMHMGPFFLEELGEAEYFVKYPSRLPDDVEVDRLEVIFGQYSHHFILYEFNQKPDTVNNMGFRLSNAHVQTRLISVQQFSDTLDLPNGSAFSFSKGTWFDLNTHYINYSTDKVAGCEAYINFYTKPKGTAKQEMKVELLANPTILIPNNNQVYTFDAADYGWSSQVRYIWGMTSHTHKYGIDFDIYKRTVFNSRDDKIFDAEYMDGDPTGLFIGYDYQHPPIRFWDDFLASPRNEGFILEAKYQNNGPRTVGWGNTSDDEMMVAAYFYLEDTTGIGTSTGVKEEIYADTRIELAPNPFSDHTYLLIDQLPANQATMAVYDLSGRQLVQRELALSPNQKQRIRIARENLPAGMFLLQLTDKSGLLIHSEKLFIR